MGFATLVCLLAGFLYHRRHSRPLIMDGQDAKWSVRNEIAFVRGGTPDEGTIHVARPDGTGERRLARGEDPDWSPDGRRLVFVTPSGQIATISRSGRRLRRVTRDQRCPGTSPVFSPGGGQIAFIRWPNENPRCPTEGLVVARTDGRHLRRLARGDQVTNQAYVDWQPLRRRR